MQAGTRSVGVVHNRFSLTVAGDEGEGEEGSPLALGEGLFARVDQSLQTLVLDHRKLAMLALFEFLDLQSASRNWESKMSRKYFLGTFRRHPKLDFQTRLAFSWQPPMPRAETRDVTNA